MTAMHLVRPGARQRKAQAAPARSSYPPGYFTEPVRAWWPMWESRMDAPKQGRDMCALAHAARRAAAETGTGWGRGTVLMPGTPKNDAPGWL